MSLIEALLERRKLQSNVEIAGRPPKPPVKKEPVSTSADDLDTDDGEDVGIKEARRREKAAEEKWEFLSEPKELLSKIYSAYAVVSGVLSHKNFTDASGADRGEVQNSQANAGIAYSNAKLKSEVLTKIVSLGEAAKDGVEIILKLPDISVSISGLPAVPNGQQAAAHAEGRKILKALFPDLRLDQIELNENGHVATPLPDRKMPLEAIAAIDIGDGKLDMTSWTKEFRGLVKFILEPFDLVAYDTDRAGNINDHMDLSFEVGVRVHIKLPREYCLWSTSSEDNNYSPVLSWLHFKKMHQWMSSEKPKGKPKGKTDNPDKIKALHEKMQNKYDLVPKPMVNHEGICCLPGYQQESKLHSILVWVPPGGEISVSGLLNNCLEKSTEVDGGQQSEINFKAMASRHVGTDWLLNKMLLTDDAGKFHMVDLNGARIPTPQAWAHVMNGKCTTEMLGAIANLAVRLDVGLPSDFASMVEGQEDPELVLRWENMIDVPYDSNEDSNAPLNEAGVTARQQSYFKLGKMLAELYTKLVASSIPAYEQYEIRPYLAIFGVYASKRLEWGKMLTTQMALNRASVDPESPPVLHDMFGKGGGNPTAMPHQVRVANELHTNPECAMLDIRAGGGKTWSMVTDVTDLMSKGLIKRPVIAMPRNLLPQFAQELVAFTKGHFRPFILSNNVWGSLTWSHRNRMDPRAVTNLLKRQPRNTIFLVDYGWLAQKGEDVQAFDAGEPFYPHAAILSSLNPDYVAADESQRAKKLTSGRSRAIAALYAGAKYRRIASGTILHNTARDLIGQMSLLDPLALGDVGKDIAENDKVNDRPQLKENMAKFARQIHVPRREWAHLLPPVFENTVLCNMTDMQRKFNSKVMQDIMTTLLDDPKILALMKDDSDKAQKAIAAMMKRYFAGLEIWLNAPDAIGPKTYGNTFTQLDGITPADLVSPKVIEVDKLIELHFKGDKAYDLNGDGKLVDLKPDANKIIVTAINIEAAKHLYRHSRFAAQGVLYMAGNNKAIEEFLSQDDGSPKILYAASTSIQEGKNFQIASRLIHTQIPWIPGAQEQLNARIWRPDVPDKDGKIKFYRERIFIDYLIVNPSIEVPKMARLIGKQVENLLIEEQEHNKDLDKLVNDFPRTFEKVKRVKMNLDYLQKLDLEYDKSNKTPDILSEQFDAYRLTKNWEQTEFATARAKLRAKVEARKGRKIDNKDLARESMVECKSIPTKEFDPGKALQAQGFIPFTEGFNGWNPTNLNLIPLSTRPEQQSEEEEDENESDDEESADMEETVHVEIGDPVLTEFGPGYVTAARKSAKATFVSVYIPGYGQGAADKPLRMWRYQVLGATNDVDREALRALLKNAGSNGLPTLKFNEDNQTITPVLNKIPNDTVDATILHMKKLEAKGKLPGRPAIEKIPRNAETPKVQRGQPGLDDDEDEMIPSDSPLIRKLKNIAPETPRNVSRAPGIKNKDDPFVKNNKTVPRQPPQVMDTPKGKVPVKSPIPENRMPIKDSRVNMTKVDKDLGFQKVEGEAIILNGLVCIAVLSDEAGDAGSDLLKNGFNLIGKSLQIKVPNPKVYMALVDMLARKYTIPRVNKAYLDTFGKIYQKKMQDIAYARNKELPAHAIWVKDNRKKGGPDEIRPYPVVENNAVYLYANYEVCPAVKQLRNIAITTPKQGKVKLQTKIMHATYVGMVKSVSDARRLLKVLEAKKIRFTNADEVIDQLKHIKG